ncbi:MAG: hypothetical protein IPL65_07405 [Lewinellaceae bacterium]|nr:hypothetical protein [Lewinellaceae bacterium]
MLAQEDEPDAGAEGSFSKSSPLIPGSENSQFIGRLHAARLVPPELTTKDAYGTPVKVTKIFSVWAENSRQYQQAAPDLMLDRPTANR